jgi:hypothetical protein
VERRRLALRRDLQPSLQPRAFVRLVRAAPRLRVERERQLGQRGHRRHGTGLELASLQPRDPGHERQVIVERSPLAAGPGPAADGAMLDRLGIVGARQRVVRHRNGGKHALEHQAEVRGVLVEPVRLRLDRRYHLKALGAHSLRRRQHLRVQPELEDRPGLRLARELGVGDLVGPVAERARSGNALKNVGISEPGAISQCALDYDIRAVAHRLERRRHPSIRIAGIPQLDDGPPLGSELVHVPRLVVESSLPEHPQQGVVVARRRRVRAERGTHVEGGAMTAGEEAGEVGGREDELGVLLAHYELGTGDSGFVARSGIGTIHHRGHRGAQRTAEGARRSTSFPRNDEEHRKRETPRHFAL